MLPEEITRMGATQRLFTFSRDGHVLNVGVGPLVITADTLKKGIAQRIKGRACDPAARAMILDQKAWHWWHGWSPFMGMMVG